ncbi:MAG: AAA family ATPase [Pseudomonadales bacterium]
MKRPNAYPHPTSEIHVIETHISWVILTGEYAYKIKKPIKLPFLDFSSLESRKFYCNEELRLNGRLAPDLYLDVVGIYGSHSQPTLCGTGEPVEYAVKMQQFPGDQQLDLFLRQNRLESKSVDELAGYLADFHQTSMSATVGEFGSPDAVAKPALENFELLEAKPFNSLATGSERSLRQWCKQQCSTLRLVFSARKAAGKIRECHGDLHLGNLALVGKKIIAFDCIEFDPGLRFLDVMDEIGFLFMDFLAHGHTQSGYRFLNRYLEISGDYAGLAVLNFYAVYRAVVRAKVTALRLQQDPDAKELQSIKHDYARYVALADQLIQRCEPALILMCGLSGSGKSTVAEQLMCELPAVRIRSDLERKRLHNMDQLQHTATNINSGIYSTQATQQLYQYLRRLTREIAAAGYSVIVDASFLQRQNRDRFVALARQIGLPVLILWCRADESVLRKRITQRTVNGLDPSDADERILEYQLQHADLPRGNELSYTLEVDTAKGKAKDLPGDIHRALARDKSEQIAL